MASFGVAADNRVQQIVEPPAVGEAQHRQHVAGLDLAAAMRQRLIEDGKPVAHRAFRRARDERERFRLGLSAPRP